MLKDVRIQNYRLFEDLQLNDLGRVNLIVGQNNVGKTSLLEALYLLTSKNNPFALFEICEHRYSSFLHTLPYSSDPDSSESREKNFELLFASFMDFLFNTKFLQKEKKINIQGNNQSYISLEMTAKMKEFINYKTSTFFEELFFVYKTEGQNNIDFILHPEGVSSSSINSSELFSNSLNAFYISPIVFGYHNMAGIWNQITLTPQEDYLIKILQIIEPAIERINFKSGKESDDILVKLKNNPNPISLHSFGNGLSYLLKIGLHLVLAKDGVLCIDEIDTGLHYRMMTQMWKVILQTAQELNVQVFTTTHSWDCIKAFSEALKGQENSDLGRLIRLQQYEDGEIEAVNYTPEELSFNVFQEIEVR